MRPGPGFLLLISVLVAVATGVWAEATPPKASSTPEAVVQRYLEALQKEDFATAYDCLSKGMVQGKARDTWAAEARALLRLTETTITRIRVFPGKIAGDKALVPNLLDSKDKFINQLGLPEHELYTLVREDGNWKVDQQQLLEPAEQEKWFPAEVRAH